MAIGRSCQASLEQRAMLAVVVALGGSFDGDVNYSASRKH